MYQFIRSEKIEATPEQVFDFVTDQSRLRTWSPEVLESQPLDDAPMHAGSVLRQRRLQGDREMVNDVEVTAHERPLRHAVHTRVLGVDMSFTYTFEPDGSATRVQMACELQGHGLGRLFENRVAREVEAADEHRLDELRIAMGLTSAKARTD